MTDPFKDPTPEAVVLTRRFHAPPGADGRLIHPRNRAAHQSPGGKDLAAAGANRPLASPVPGGVVRVQGFPGAAVPGGTGLILAGYGGAGRAASRMKGAHPLRHLEGERTLPSAITQRRMTS
ncbi:hypothetical protein GCM10010319_10240 [Streptomyces blastmyceticus]|uniref:Uncharacterized protein n=1 Tax=Streptomyces blastmyceticus TaxID=68180 RepID=A0ABN0WG17_9ACTN